MHSLNNNTLKITVSVCLALISIVLSNNVVLCQTITSLNCSTTPDSTTHDGINKTTFRYNCSTVINRAGKTNLRAGVYATNATSTHTTGNGNESITITTPQSRFLVDGPDQGPGTPVAITTNSSSATITMVKTNIDTDADASFNFDLLFINFDADKAENTYQQGFRMSVFRNTTATSTTTTRYIEYTVPDKVYITATNPPTCSIDTANEVYDPTHYEESNNDVSIDVKSNNTWLLKVKLDSTPTETLNNFTIPATQNYFECNSGSGYTCWSGADVKIQYPGAGADSSNYIEIAKDPDQVRGNYRTGTTDNMSLDAITLSFTEFLKNEATAYQPGTYNATMTFDITAPR